MKKLLILAFLISPIFLYSQELDEAYLESLPEDVREDVLKEMENQKKIRNLYIEDHPQWLRNSKL